MSFDNELEFEHALVSELVANGWTDGVLNHPTEKDLLDNWAKILFENNRQIDRLNDYPLTDTEMQQILEQIRQLRTPLKLNSFINGKTISIHRDNVNDKEHFGKEVSLKIYDRDEIAAGESRYQIAEQPIFNKKSYVLNDRRGDLMLLINGMPVINIELKKSNVPVSQATNQIEKYAHEGVFEGIFSLVQIFVGMNPEETVYFANPGPDGKFNPDFFFHWEDFNNEPINDWKKISSSLLHIPMAHQLIGFYTIPDDTDEVLKVMRSYQYYASNEISGRVSKTDWGNPNVRGGYIWHTTGSGKTMTSFKSAQLIANSKDADKVIFLIDRIELGTQSLRDYRGFADANESVQATEDTNVLITKLKSDDIADTLIVTSIQKMSRIKEDAGLRDEDIRIINKKRIVFIVDECHRSQFGEMHQTIKDNFPRAVFFGFTGTPILAENKKNMSDTSDVFGNELHRYSIADGIRDKNVLGFDVYKVLTFKDSDIKRVVALDKAKASDEHDVYQNPEKEQIYYDYINKNMAGYEDENGNYIKGIEDYLVTKQYHSREHQEKVVENILENWVTLSHNSKFHAIFATSSIHEAIEYYRLFKEKESGLKITALVDPNIDNKGDFTFKEDGLIELLEDYEKYFGLKYSLSSSGAFKKDVSLRLAHKKPYTNLRKDEQVDILIVVDQMLTGFDSKWINTLYLDKVLKYESIIQAFSRTNRLFGPDKPFGTIKYYRKPYTMEKNIEKAIKLYSGDKPFGLFVPKLEDNVKKMDYLYKQILDLFDSEKIEDFSRLPENRESRRQFVSLFNEFNKYLEAARIQGYKFNSEEKKDVIILNEESKVAEDSVTYELYSSISSEEFSALKQRYKEVSSSKDSKDREAPYDIKGYITELDPVKINQDYIDSKFKKYLKNLHQENISEEELNQNLNDLHKSFSTLSQEEQKYANIFLHDIQSGNIEIIEGKSFMDYVTEYQKNAENDIIKQLSQCLGVDEIKLRKMVNSNIDESNINEFGRFDDLKNTIDIIQAKHYFDDIEKRDVPIFEVNLKIDKLLRKFIIDGNLD